MDCAKKVGFVNSIDLNQSLNIERLSLVSFYSQAMIGDFKFTARTADGLGWLICDGRTLQRDIYRALFDVIGTSFGAPSGTTFKIPDFRGRVPGVIGQGTGLSARSLGTAVGAETHTLSISEMPSHTHTINDPGHIHTGDDFPAGIQKTDNAFGTESAASANLTTNNVNSNTTGITINSTGGDQPHNNMQPTLFGGNIMIFVGLI